LQRDKENKKRKKTRFNHSNYKNIMSEEFKRSSPQRLKNKKFIKNCMKGNTDRFDKNIGQIPFDRIKFAFKHTSHENVYTRILDWCNKKFSNQQISSLLEDGLHNELFDFIDVIFEDDSSEEDDLFNHNKIMNATKVKFLIENGASIDCGDDISFLFASKIYELDKNLFDKLIKNCEKYYNTLLILYHGENYCEKEEIMLRMLSLGYDTYTDEYGRNLLIHEFIHYAKYYAHMKTDERISFNRYIDILLKSKINLFHKDKNKHNILDYVAERDEYYLNYFTKIYEDNNKENEISNEVLRQLYNNKRQNTKTKEKFMSINIQNYVINDVKNIIKSYIV
jgi:hypothetical protein